MITAVATLPGRPRLSEAQWTFLRLVEQFGGDEGWAEITLQFDCERDLPQYLVGAIVDRVAKALERKGLITRAANGPELTDAGRAALGGS